jgi:predicted unusual protein kinase regulating ubiquinone biosynthesis (AarF/ABC1/UbiB family)
VQEVPAGFRAGALELARAVLARDAASAAAALRALGLSTRDPEAATIERFAEKLMTHLDGVRGPLAAERIPKLGDELSALLRADPLATLPPHLFLLGRVLGLLAGVSAQLGVRVNLARALLPGLWQAAAAR